MKACEKCGMYPNEAERMGAMKHVCAKPVVEEAPKPVRRRAPKPKPVDDEE